MDDKSSNVSGSPGSTNNHPSGAMKRQRSNTPPPLLSSSSSSNHNNNVSSALDLKVQLTTNLLYLNGTDLGHVMSLLEQHCPKVLETYNNSNSTNKSNNDVGSLPPPLLQVPECVEINMDMLMEEYHSIFIMIQQYCHDHMNQKRALSCNHNHTNGNTNSIKIKDISNKRKERKT
jgi:hypothetical protein